MTVKQWQFTGDRKSDVAQVSAWAREVLDDPATVILDTETTGLVEPWLVEIAVVDRRGKPLLDTLVDPGEPIPHAASAIHGITTDAVAGAPAFADILAYLGGAILQRRVVIYNAPFDITVLRRELERAHAAGAAGGSAGDVAGFVRAWADQARSWECAMAAWSAWCGDWSTYHGDYKFQRLNGGHRTAADCRAVIARLNEMARGGGHR